LSGCCLARTRRGVTVRSVVDMAIFASHLLYEGQPALLVAAVDVTEQNRVEARLRETQGFLDTVIENVPSTIVVKDAHTLRSPGGHLLCVVPVHSDPETFAASARTWP